MSALADWRAVAYRLFAALFLEPDERRWSWLAQAAHELQYADDALACFAFFGAWRRLLATIQSSTEEDVLRAYGEYDRLFVTGRDLLGCPPYESAHVTSDPEQAGLLAVQLKRAYARGGLEVAPGGARAPDHVAVELEFMAFLCQREGAAWQEERVQDGLRILTQQRAFLHQHLGAWLGRFSQQVQAATRDPLYTVAAETTHVFVQHDVDLTTLLLSSLPGSVEQQRSRLPKGESADERHE